LNNQTVGDTLLQ